MGTFTNSTYTNTIKSLVEATESKINNPFYKFSDKKPFECTYFKQNREKSTLDEVTALNYSHIGEDSPIRFNQINNFYVYGFDKIGLDYDLTDFGLESSEITGECIILPNTIIPLPGDFFKITQIKEDVLFKVNKVTPDTLDTGANIYKIEYKLELVNQYENILKQVVAVYNFVIENVGTDFSCFISSENYSLATELSELQQYLIDAYQIFFDPGVQTFVFEYNGTLMYDPYLIEFIIRNKVLSTASEYFFVHHATAMGKTFNYDYTKTFFAMLEDPTIFDMGRACKQVAATLIEDPNSLFVTRLREYYKLDYFPKYAYITKFYPIDVEVMMHIADGSYFDSSNPLAAFNAWVAYFSNDTDNMTTDILSIIRNTEYYNCKEFYYLIPVCIFILGKTIGSIMQDTDTSSNP